jgi:hypothetical protein
MSKLGEEPKHPQTMCLTKYLNPGSQLLGVLMSYP